jgi:hypothetical protein
MAIHHASDRDAVEGVGLTEWGSDPERRARAMSAVGGGILMLSVAGIVLCLVASAFGLAPLAVPLMVLFVLAALFGRWLRERGAVRLRHLLAEAARHERR